MAATEADHDAQRQAAARLQPQERCLPPGQPGTGEERPAERTPMRGAASKPKPHVKNRRGRTRGKLATYPATSTGRRLPWRAGSPTGATR